MKALIYLCSLSLAAMAYAIDKSGTEIEKGDAVIVTVEADDNGNMTKNVKVIELKGDNNVFQHQGDGGHAIFVSAVADGDTVSDQDIRVLTHIDHAVDPNRGWLGVALGQTTDGHGEGGSTGVVVTNVVTDSPAERAGLLKDDIITAVNGEAVSGGVGSLAKKIGELGPDAEVVFSVLRDGEALDVTATLSSPKAGSIQWHHSPNFKIRERIHTSPHVGMFTPHGKMKIMTTDDMGELPDAVVEFLNQNGTSMQMSVEDGHRVINIKNDDNGEVVEIQQEGEGAIVVKRYTAGEDDVTETEYADAAALEAGDADAFEIYQAHADRGANVWLGQDGQTYKFDFNFDFDPEDFDFDGLDGNTFQFLHDLHPDAMAEAHEAIQNALGNIEFQFSPNHHAMFVGKASRSFKVQPDGTIEMTVRKGDTEVVTVFADEDDLAARDPEAFDRFDAVQNADIED